MAKNSPPRFFSLIEVLVGLSLTAALLGTLLLLYRTTARAHQGVDEALRTARAQLTLDNRLQELFFAVPTADERGFWFYTDLDSTTSRPVLVFSYHNGVDPDPKFSALVLGRLYLDEYHRLLLATWPHPERHGTEHSPRIEVLANTISDLSFRFYEPPSLRDPSLPPQPELAITQGHQHLSPPSAREMSTWLTAYHDTPAMVTVCLLWSDQPPLTLRYTLRGIKKTPHTWYYSKEKSA